MRRARKALRDVSQDSYPGGESAKMKTPQVGGGGGLAVRGQLSHIYSRLYKLQGCETPQNILIIRMESKGRKKI